MFGVFARQVSTAHLPVAATDRKAEDDPKRLLEAMQRLARAQLIIAADLPKGDIGQALIAIQMCRLDKGKSNRLKLAAVAKEASEAAINVGWTTYDIGEIAQSTQTIASAVEELAASIGEVSETSHSAGRNAFAAREAMSACWDDVQQAQKAMEAIEARTHQIDQRLTVLQRAIADIGGMANTIASISGQTNLLALNATIEAARAGEAGRGFSVVAAEVKALSGQTAKSTEQIRAGLATLQSEMEHISHAVAESREAVEKGSLIVTGLGTRVENASAQIAQTNDMSQSLAATIDQQRAATAEVSSSVQGIAEKATKTRSEIENITKRLVKAEGLAQAALNSDQDVSESAELTRLAADIGYWKRNLANVLVGAAKPTRAIAEMRGGAAQKAVDAMIARPDVDQAVRDRFSKAAAKAQSEAERMVDAISVGNWDAGTPAYREASAAMKEMLEVAQHLI
ncbi:chemotaxis protein [Methylobacterium sp. C25]|uniref:methyl-accepting chemotaxis protein n=1 Tax=Methylobacterium sp. C25 TaxID=2721622 RepID=UPI001F4044FB|nr:methyl-accepting chemotaxis protein [Methylobacterium sp. C25]MCE4226968.1 chemotaxis protein [Methylobacterium sp. C25]